MSLPGPISGLKRVVFVAAVALMAGIGPAGHAQDKKPDPKKPDAASQAQAQAQAQAEEVQNLVRMADAAMSGQQAPSDFPIQFQNDFLKAQDARVWVPITLTLDPAKLTSGAITLYLRVTPRGMTAPPPAAAPAAAPEDAEEERQGQQETEGRRPSPPASDLSVRGRLVSRAEACARSAAAHHARHRRAQRQLRPLHRPARACSRRHDAEGSSAQAAARRARITRPASSRPARFFSPSASTS